jgi:hypothetical protein
MGPIEVRDLELSEAYLAIEAEATRHELKGCSPGGEPHHRCRLCTGFLMGLGHKASGKIASHEPATVSGTARLVDARADHARVPTSTSLIQVNEGRPERG